MKTKELALSIILHAFLGYLWILFIDHIVGMANSLDNTFVVGGIFIMIGTTLFWEMVKKVTPYNEYKFTNPVKLAGFSSFALIVFVHVFFINLI